MIHQNAKQGVLNGDDLLIALRKGLEEIEHCIPLFNSVKDAPTVIEQSRQAGHGFAGIKRNQTQPTTAANSSSPRTATAPPATPILPTTPH